MSAAVRIDEVDVVNGAFRHTDGDSATGWDGWKAWTLLHVVAAIAMATSAVDAA